MRQSPIQTKEVTIKVEVFDRHIILTNQQGHTYVTKQEELQDFISYDDKTDLKVAKAIYVIKKAMGEDKSEGGYYHSWQANIAMAFKDEFDRYFPGQCIISAEDIHCVANKAAQNFLNTLLTSDHCYSCGVPVDVHGTSCGWQNANNLLLSSQKENFSTYVRNGYSVYCLDDYNIAIFNDKTGFVVRRDHGDDYHILFKNCQPATRREYFDFISENKQP